MTKIPNSSVSIIGQDVHVICTDAQEKCMLKNMTDNPCVQFVKTQHNGVLEGRLASCVSNSAWDLYASAIETCTECCRRVIRAKGR